MAASETAAPTGTPPSSQAAQSQGVAAFINKVWSILANEEYNKLISWSECGKNVIVHDYPNFSKEILPHYFKHNNFNSFVRQLNLYGFRKVSRPEQNVLSKVQVSEPVEFWHPNFRRGHPDLLHLVQRRPVTSRIGPEEKSTELSKVLTDIHTMKGKQENIGDMLEAMKQDNAHLRRELELLRQRHTRQQRVLNKIIQFLIHMVYKGRLPASGRRGIPDSRYLMLTDSEEAAPPAKRGRMTFDPYPDSPLDISDLAEVCDLPIKAGQDIGAIDSDTPLLPLPTITSPLLPLPTITSPLLPLPTITSPPLPFPTITSPPASPPDMNPSLVNRATGTHYGLESAQPAPGIPVTSTTLPSGPPATTNALATITPSLPSSSPSSSSYSLSPLPVNAASLLPAFPDTNTQTSPNTSAVAVAELASHTVYPDWSNVTGHMDSHQQELDSLPDFLSNQLSFDPTILNQFITFGDTVPDYDAIYTARLLETLSQEEDDESAVRREKSPQTALVPVTTTSQPLIEDDDQSSSLRELLELSKDT